MQPPVTGRLRGGLAEYFLLFVLPGKTGKLDIDCGIMRFISTKAEERWQ